MLVQFFALLVQLGQVHFFCFVGALLALASGKAERRQVHFFVLLVHLRQVHPLKDLYAERLLVELNALPTNIIVNEALVCQLVRRAVVQCTVGE